MGTYQIDTINIPENPLFTVIFTQDLPTVDRAVAAFHWTILRAVDKFEAGKECIASLGGYGTIIAVLDGSHIPVLQGPLTYIWDDIVKYQTKEINVTKLVNSSP